MNLCYGEHEIIRDVDGLTYPLKIVFSVKGETVTVITNYPLMKGRNKWENEDK